MKANRRPTEGHKGSLFTKIRAINKGRRWGLGWVNVLVSLMAMDFCAISEPEECTWKVNVGQRIFGIDIFPIRSHFQMGFWTLERGEEMVHGSCSVVKECVFVIRAPLAHSSLARLQVSKKISLLDYRANHKKSYKKILFTWKLKHPVTLEGQHCKNLSRKKMFIAMIPTSFIVELLLS